MADASFAFRRVDVLGRDRDDYKALHNHLFHNTAMSSEWIDWYHSGVSTAGGGAPSRTHGAYDGSKLVGVWSVEPRRFSVDGKSVIPVGHCFAVGIHADYRRHGLFVALSEYAIAEERKLAELDFIFGFPQQGRPVIGGHMKAGWELVLDVDALRIQADAMDLGTPRSTVEPLSAFRAAPAMSPGSFVVSADYLDRRWLRHPDNQYITLAHEDGFIVLKPYGGVCHVLELQGSGKSARVLLGAATTLCRRHGWKELNAWAAATECYRGQMTDAGFVAGAEFALPVVLIAVRIRSREPLALAKGCHLPIGIEEIY